MSLVKFLLVWCGKKLAQLGALVNAPWLTAVIISLTTRRMGSGKKFKVLCISRSVFMDDVAALAEYGGGQIEYIVAIGGFFRAVCSTFIGDGLVCNHKNYYQHRGSLHLKYQAFIERVIDILRAKLNFDAVLAGNYVYAYLQEPAAVCLKKKIPFIVLHKEGIGAEGRLGDVVKTYTNRKFVGNKILVYNNAMMHAMLECGVDGVFADMIEIVGVPRLDFYRRCTTQAASRKKLLFFSFYPKDKFTYLMKDKDMLAAAVRRGDDFHRLVVEFTLDNPEIEVLIKTKSSSKYLEYVRKIINEISGGKKINNLVLTNRGAPFKLIQEASVVAGFNSFTLVEAMLMGRKIISPQFADIAGNMSHDYFQNRRELVKYVSSVKDIEDAMNGSGITEELTPETYLFLKNMISEPDGHASERAEHAIVKTIENMRNQDT